MVKNFQTIESRDSRIKKYTECSGMIVWRISYTKITTKVDATVMEKINIARAVRVNPFVKMTLVYIKVKTIAVTSSTSGYWNEICSLQVAHFPRNPRKEKTGISSYHDSVVLQRRQAERPLAKLRPVFILKIMTFRKLPIISPRINIKTGTNIMLLLYQVISSKQNAALNAAFRTYAI